MNEHVQATLPSTVTSKGQTTIPKQFRDAMGITDGTPLRWTLENGVLTVRAKTKRLEEYAGMLGRPPNARHATIEDMNQAIGEAVAERHRRATDK